jgi:hypothetical protein
MFQGLLPQPWIEVYASELARLFEMENVPCVRSKRFFLDELQGGCLRSEIHKANIFKENERAFLICSITATIPDLVQTVMYTRTIITPKLTHNILETWEIRTEAFFLSSGIPKMMMFAGIN